MSYVVDVPLRWSDMDAYGHVNNVQFLRLLEDARVVAFADWFGTDRSLLEAGVVVSRHEIDYLAPLAHRLAPVRIALWPSRIGGASFDVGYEVGEPDSGIRYARAESTLAAYDFAASSPRRLTAAERATLRSFEREPVRLRRHR